MKMKETNNFEFFIETILRRLKKNNPNSHPGYWAGNYYRLFNLSFNTIAGETYVETAVTFFPFDILKKISFSRFGTELTTASPGNILYFAIYSNLNGLPGTLLSDNSLFINGSSAGFTEVNNSLTLSPGNYYLGILKTASNPLRIRHMNTTSSITNTSYLPVTGTTANTYYTALRENTLSFDFTNFTFSSSLTSRAISDYSSTAVTALVPDIRVFV